MSKVTKIIIAVLVAAFAGFTIYSIVSRNKTPKLEGIDYNSVISANDQNGGIGDHVKGNPEAPVLIFEYADYQCPGCANLNPRINKVVEDYAGKVGLVYRSFLLSYHQNGTAAASAAEAASLQGYWKQYADELFATQSEWEDATASERTDLFVKMFEKVSNGVGDTERFKSDMNSGNVKAKIDFDMSIGKAIDVSATPALYIDGEFIDWTKTSNEKEFYDFMHKTIDAKLEAKNAQ